MSIRGLRASIMSIRDQRFPHSMQLQIGSKNPLTFSLLKDTNSETLFLFTFNLYVEPYKHCFRCLFTVHDVYQSGLIIHKCACRADYSNLPSWLSYSILAFSIPVFKFLFSSIHVTIFTYFTSIPTF